MIKSEQTEKLAFWLLLLATIIIILPVALVVILVLVKGVPAITPEFIFGMPRDGMRAGGVFPAIVGTLCLMLGTAVFSLPFGILAAIYLNEYSQKNWLSRIIELAIINLAGVPSIVYGLFGLGLFVTFLQFGASILAGSLTLAIMTLPVIITATREALNTVPKAFREVSFSLGASCWQTVRYAVLPNAIPGIITGSILGLSRAAGETAPILFTVAAFYLPSLPQSVYDQVMALPYHIYVLSTQVPNVSEKIQYGTVLVLVGMIFVMNIIAAYFRTKLRKRKTW
ncbi:MAG: phosphate ABC transporter permease PstA [Candidatus Margulisbacteria bacterium]|nr:phosphate ABC transporter permease PstA [Candidatus Margulisiibacteriota bacterium]